MRKYIQTILILTTWATISNAQINLAPNPSFEDTLQCPISLADFGSVVSWSSYSGTADYYNICNTDPFPSCGVPGNWYGFQYPHSGNAYYGIITYGGVTEIIGAPLTTSLIIGQKYYTSMHVCSANITIESGYGANKLGFLFMNSSYDFSNPVPINNFAQVYSNSIVTDTLNWTKLFGSFVADSAYSFVAIGNLFDNAHTDTIGWCNCGTQVAYYYIDDVCISTDSIYTATYTGIKESNKTSNYKVYPNPTTQFAKLEFNNPTKQNCTLTIYDFRGQVEQSIKNITSNEIEIERRNITNGLYFFQLRSDKQIIASGKLTFE